MTRIPKSYVKAPDGSILKVTGMFQKDSSNTVVPVIDGFTKSKADIVETFFEANAPPLYITLTVEYPNPDEIEINFQDSLGAQSLTDFSVDKGDGVFVDYVQLSFISILPLGSDIIIKSIDDVYEVSVTDAQGFK